MFQAILQNIYITFDEQIVQQNLCLRRIIREKKRIMKVQLYYHNIKSGWKSSVALIYSGIRDIPISITVLWACIVYIFSAFNACAVYPQQTVKIYCAKNVLNSIVRHTYRTFEISMKACIPQSKVNIDADHVYCILTSRSNKKFQHSHHLYGRIFYCDFSEHHMSQNNIY